MSTQIREWVSGWNGGLTGPTCPAVGGVTAGEQVAYRRWVDGGYVGDKPEPMSYPVACGMETVAIAIGKTMEQAKFRSHILAAAPELYESLLALRSLLWSEGYADQTPAMAQADAVIRKAEGK